MKKNIVAVLLLAILLTLFAGCNSKEKNNDYFNNFEFRQSFNAAEMSISLPENVSVYSYDVENDLFVIFMKVLNSYDDSEYINLFGLATSDEILLSPTYTSILQIKGDYAIVAKPAQGVDTSGNPVLRPTVGVIKFRGEGKGEKTDFRTPYASSYTQFAFVGDYIVTVGTKEYALSDFNFSTFYDYSRGSLLEVFRVRCGSDYEFMCNDGYLVAIGKDHAFFYETSAVLTDGYLNFDERGLYMAYPEDTGGDYTEAITVNIYYLGNGWFTRTARLESTEEFEGYTMKYEKTDASTGQTQLVYANVRSDLYDAKTRSSTQKEWLVVDAVANKYSADYYTEMASYLNNLAVFDETTGRYEYSLPYANIASLVKDGYSIVYYYYLPYADSGNYQSEITFCLMNDKAEIITINDMLMPPVFVGGYGVETSDPMYDKYYGDVFCYDYSLEKYTLASYEGGTKTYATYIYHDYCVVASEINYTSNSILYGMVDTSGKQILPFIYEELSPFYGGYAIGRRKVDGVYKTFIIDKSGKEKLITDMVNVRQGVYVYSESEKLGLKNYEGKIIMAAEYESLEVFEVFMQNGVYQTDYVIASKDGITSIYKLN